MALEGFKYWADGEPVTGVDANTFLMSQSVMRFENASDRDSALARTLTTGMVAYLKDTTMLQIYDGTSWVNVALGSSGVTDHGALTGLVDDDHTQYHNDTRGDARYLQLSGGTLTGALTIQRSGSEPANFVEIYNTDNATGEKAGIKVRTGSGWSTTFHTEQNNWWHAFGDGSGTVKWGFDGTTLKNLSGGATFTGNVGINTGSPAAPLHVAGEIIHASQWAGVSGPTSWASAYTNNWNQARDQGSFMTASSTGITINRSGRYHVISGQRANSTNDTYYGIGANGSRTALENRTTGIWSHDHSGYPNLWAKSVYIGYLAAGEKLTGGAPNSTYAGRFTFSTAGWAGFLIAHYLGD